jgi:ABC-2 type transport system permease protein
MALIFPAFIMIAGLMAAVGAMVTEGREAQQMATIFTLPLFVPLWFVGPLMTNPNSPLVVGMSLFPLTSPMTMPLRAAFTTVPTWQLVTSLAILYLCAAGALILAGRAFRIGMLQYGRRIKWREIFQRG